MAILLNLVKKNVDAVRMRTLNKGMAARYQQENHVTRYPVILYRSVGIRHTLSSYIYRSVAFMRKVAEATSCLPKTLQTT